MNWYYALNGQQQGPVPETEIASLAAAGTITADTLIWSEGLPDWQPLSLALPAALGTAPINAPQLGGVAVPESQKDLFVQQMREGMSPNLPGTMVFGGFWIRFVAKLIDSLILMVPNFILQFLAGMSMGIADMPAQGHPKELSPEQLVLLLAVAGASMAIQVAYNTFLVGKYGATWGKMALGLKVVNEDGSKVTMLRAFGRTFAEMLSGLTCWIGYIIAAFDSEKRSLHDHVCTTRVVLRR